ncbi:MAG: hypothetical protein ACI9VR_000900 [Cognaticolwellia sp.]|jgi:hypothetical protein
MSLNKLILMALGGLLLTSCTKDGEVEDTETIDDTEVEDTGTDDTGEADAYVFASAEASAYTRVDRVGMPAINTAVIASKDAYNQADPADDANGDFVAEIVASLNFLHGALDDDLTGLGLTPCDVDTCVAQAAPLVVPDTLQIDTTGTAGFPNGRGLEDPVIDVTLAVVLLDLSVHSAVTLVGVNPTANDKAFQATFPYLAPAH